jgi:GTP-binding protein
LLRTLRAIGEADVVALMVDAEEGPTVQDAHIASYILEAGKGLVLVVNKWDTVEKAGDVQEQWFTKLTQSFSFLPQPPVVFLSALTGAKVDRLYRAVEDVYHASGFRADTGKLNRFVQEKLIGPDGQGRKGARLYYLTQVSTRPPTFVVFVNKAELWKPNQRRQLENAIRDEYGLVGTPVILKFRSRKPSEGTPA